MLLESRLAAQALNVDEKTILRWIREENLPAEQVDGEYRSDPVDLLEWATERGIKVNPSLYDLNEEHYYNLPALSHALLAGGIHKGVAGANKEAVLRGVVAQLSLPPEIDQDFILQVLLAREAMGTTAIGDGIAIPHVRNPILVQLPEPKVSLSYLAQPVDFGALDGKPVRILFSIITSEIRTHLHLLSRLSFCLDDPRLRQVLMREGDLEEVVSAVREIERDIDKLALDC